ncbi:MAG: prepilin-type N-terminal cleavage/methylation domain-containing protein [Candidatus Omnitrophica bacterium]|nr:prepilin-type N-terminal cleavage/methylation domain-containing protein [Candidatus Omnitrophota bacterium]
MKKSFTLIELIVVIAIIAILAAIIAPNAFKAIEKAKISADIAEAKSLKTAIMSLYADTGHFPGWRATMPATGYNYARLDDTQYTGWDPSNLMTNASGWFGWEGPYMEKMSALNRWGGTNYLLYDARTTLSWARGVRYTRYFRCYSPVSPATNTCGMPQKILDKIDEITDDGVYNSGRHRRYYAAAQKQYYSYDMFIQTYPD